MNRWQRRWKCDEVVYSELSLVEWEEFVQSRPWAALVNELMERDKYITDCLRKGDKDWSDAEMRARLDELEFVLTTPSSIIEELQLITKNNLKGELIGKTYGVGIFGFNKYTYRFIHGI